MPLASLLFRDGWITMSASGTSSVLGWKFVRIGRLQYFDRLRIISLLTGKRCMRVNEVSACDIRTITHHHKFSMTEQFLADKAQALRTELCYLKTK